jgi:hypothetical protein
VGRISNSKNDGAFMKRISCLVFIASLSISLFAQTGRIPASTPKREVLTNDSIISLVKAGFKEKTIVTLMRTSPVTFDLTASKLIQLKKNGVNEAVIQAMIQRQAMSSNTTDAFTLRDDEFFNADDNAFFNSPQRLELPELKRKDSSVSKEADIFGSRSGGQSQSRSRGGLNGDRSGSSEVTGSASVRIIKPPSESSEPKLERAPRLNNKNILDMVQAGFSEGTILRKIELEQVEFDLTPQAVAELRKNRVNEKVIKAMRAAMDESK